MFDLPKQWQDLSHVRLSSQNMKNCVFYDLSMKLLPVFVHIVRFILRSGGKSDLTSEDRERSMTSIYMNISIVPNCDVLCCGLS